MSFAVFFRSETTDGSKDRTMNENTGSEGVRGGEYACFGGVLAHLDRVTADLTGIGKDSSTPTGLFRHGSVFYDVHEEETISVLYLLLTSSEGC